jgi:hypothetical protein
MQRCISSGLRGGIQLSAKAEEGAGHTHREASEAVSSSQQTANTSQQPDVSRRASPNRAIGSCSACEMLELRSG